jgi:hypothetical protein
MDAPTQALDAGEFDKFAAASDEFLSSCDIALLNLVAAKGLPGAESLDIPTCLGKLDVWAARVRIETMRHLYRFDAPTKEPPSEFDYGNSLGRFLCYFLLQVLQEDCGVRYNPARKFQPDFCEAEDLFIHGIVNDNGAGGTCASMPVVYVAVGRRLGYPLKLVEGREHLFFRWDDQRGTFIRWPNLGDCWIAPDRFNVEGAGEGIAYHSDSYYIQWPSVWTEADFCHGRYLRSLSPTEELAAFLIQRGECFWDLGQTDEALKAYYFADKLVPNDMRYEWLHAKRTREYEMERAKDIERILEINECNRPGMGEQQRKTPVRPGRVLKIAFGTPIPAELPSGTAIQYVPADQADSLPVAVGRLPGQRNPIAPAGGQPILTDPLAMIYRIKEQNRRLMVPQGQSKGSVPAQEYLRASDKEG